MTGDHPAGTGRRAYDVVVIGAGHAGCEAALAAIRCGSSVAMLAMSATSVAALPCNPAIGGPGKAHLVREIDALGGAMGRVADAATMHVRLLNTSKGPAVQAVRALVDKDVYAARMIAELGRCGQRLDLVLGEAARIEGNPGGPYRVVLTCGTVLDAAALVVATGVYLGAATVTGAEWRKGGPGKEPAANQLTESLQGMGFAVGRFKTGTSPRVALDSVDLEQLVADEGDDRAIGFTYRAPGASGTSGAGDVGRRAPLVCWRAHTNEQTHAVIRANFARSPLLQGEIRGRGPRHCPSIEDKVARFPDRPQHPVYLELERVGGDTLYVLGLSTSLPADAQDQMLHSLPGLAGARVTMYGYAIEYDYVRPAQLLPTLEARIWPGLFFAGQVCGTSGYEEAAALGLVAGLNAARVASGQPCVVFDRSESYIGVLTSDLTSRPITEPYRIMTARAEHRLHLRQTNADLRLTEWGLTTGLVDAARAEAARSRRAEIERVRALLERTQVRPSEASADWLAAHGSTALRETVSAASLLARPEIDYHALRELLVGLPDLGWDDLHEVAAQAKYSGYIQQQERLLERAKRRERLVSASASDKSAANKG